MVNLKQWYPFTLNVEKKKFDIIKYKWGRNNRD
jgi:hypothetical protein